MTNAERSRFNDRVRKRQQETLILKGRKVGLNLAEFRVLLMYHRKEGFDAALALLDGKPLSDPSLERDRVSQAIGRVQGGF